MNDEIRNRKSHTPLESALSFIFFHTFAMLPVGVEGYGVPIGSLMIWFVVDCPVSWIIFFLFDSFSDETFKIALLVGGALQWGMIGWLVGKFIDR